MTPEWTGVVGTLLGGILGLLGGGWQRRSDAKQRTADQELADRVRAEDRRERVDLHRLDRKHEVYANFLTAVQQHADATEERWNPAGTAVQAVESAQGGWHPGPYPRDTHAAVQRAFDELVLVAPHSVAQAAFKVVVAVDVLDTRRGWRDAASASGDTERDTAMYRKVMAAEEALNTGRRELRTAIRRDLGTGEDLDLSAMIPEE